MPRSLLFLALAWAGLVHADAGLDPEALATAAGLRDQALAGSRAYALVESLTTEVGPRLPGSPADARAVAWAQAQFQALGYDRVYLQPVRIPVWRRGEESAEVLSPFPQPLQLTQLGSSTGTGKTALEAEVVEFADLAALSAAPAGRLKGKIAFISYRMRRAQDGSGYGPAVAARRNGAAEASKKGAVALLIRSIGTDSARLPHTGNQNYVDGVAPIPAAALAHPDADLLSAMLRRGQPVTLRLRLGAGFFGSATSYNVIGEITGRERPEEVVVLGGHLDSWDLGTGAIDDASGVAITLAAGALIGQAQTPPRRTVRVVAFASEELGLLGAKAYAAAQAISAHQIGAESDFGAERIYALRAGVDPSNWPTVAAIGEVLAPLGIVTEPNGGGPGPDISPLVEGGMPWLELAQDGSHYFDLHHTADDTLDKVEAAALDQQVAAYAAMAYLAADARPRFVPLPAPAAASTH